MLAIKLEKNKIYHKNKTEDKYNRLYLLHHMHHFASKNSAKHELHHCFLYSKKNQKGQKFIIKHVTGNSMVLHAINKDCSGCLYDHANHEFKIKKIKIKNRDYFIII